MAAVLLLAERSVNRIFRSGCARAARHLKMARHFSAGIASIMKLSPRSERQILLTSVVHFAGSVSSDAPFAAMNRRVITRFRLSSQLRRLRVTKSQYCPAEPNRPEVIAIDDE